MTTKFDYRSRWDEVDVVNRRPLSISSFQTPEMFRVQDDESTSDSECSALLALKERVQEMNKIFDIEAKNKTFDHEKDDDDGIMDELFTLKLSGESLKRELEGADIMLSPRRPRSIEHRDNTNTHYSKEKYTQRHKQKQTYEFRAPPPMATEKQRRLLSKGSSSSGDTHQSSSLHSHLWDSIGDISSPPSLDSSSGSVTKIKLGDPLSSQPETKKWQRKNMHQTTTQITGTDSPKLMHLQYLNESTLSWNQKRERNKNRLYCRTHPNRQVLQSPRSKTVLLSFETNNQIETDSYRRNTHSSIECKDSSPQSVCKDFVSVHNRMNARSTRDFLQLPDLMHGKKFNQSTTSKTDSSLTSSLDKIDKQENYRQKALLYFDTRHGYHGEIAVNRLSAPLSPLSFYQPPPGTCTPLQQTIGLEPEPNSSVLHNILDGMEKCCNMTSQTLNSFIEKQKQVISKYSYFSKTFYGTFRHCYNHTRMKRKEQNCLSRRDSCSFYDNISLEDWEDMADVDAEVIPMSPILPKESIVAEDQLMSFVSNESDALLRRGTVKQNDSYENDLGLQGETKIKEIIILQNQKLLDSLIHSDHDMYRRLTDKNLTGIDIEGNVLHGNIIPEHHVKDGTPLNALMKAVRVRLLSESAAVVSYIRTDNFISGLRARPVQSRETRVWERRKGSWIQCHYHQSRLRS